MGFGKGLHRLLQRLFFPFDALLLIRQSLLGELAVTFLLQQGIPLTAGRFQSRISLFQFLLQCLPTLGITVGFHRGLLLVELLQLVLHRGEAGRQLLQSLFLGLPGLLQFTQLALTLLHAFQQWTMGALGGLTFRLQSRLALFQLTQRGTLLIHRLHQPLLFPPAGGEGFAQFQESLAQGGCLVSVTADAEAQSAVALGEAATGHGAALLEQFSFQGHRSRAAQELAGASEVGEHLGVSEHIGKDVGVDRLVANQIDSATHQASSTCGVWASSPCHGGTPTATGSSDLVEWQEGQASGPPTLEQIDGACGDAVVIHHHLAHACTGGHFERKPMALLNLTKLGNRTVDALQAGFQQ